jgi:hypothetical protein
MGVLAAIQRGVLPVLFWVAAGFVLLRLHRVCQQLETVLGSGGSELRERLQRLEDGLARIEKELGGRHSGSSPPLLYENADAGHASSPEGVPPQPVSHEIVCASRIQRAYRGHRDRMAFFQLVAQISAAAAAANGGPGGEVGGEGGDDAYLQIANRGARKFWLAHFGERRATPGEVLQAFDAWLEAGGLDGARSCLYPPLQPAYAPHVAHELCAVVCRQSTSARRSCGGSVSR